MEVQQRRDLWVGNKNDVTTVTAVAAIGTCEWLELFTANRDAPVTAVTRAKVNRHLVDK
jgi:hypothetical protein